MYFRPFFVIFALMETNILETVSIADYAKMLKSGESTEQIKEIESELNTTLGEISGGMDLALFMLQKDLLILQCKLAISIFEFEEEKQKFYERKINELRKQLEDKNKKVEKSNPYKSFLSWILAVEKYLAFSIDRSNDLLYLSEATKQMLNYYDNQKKSIEENKVKK